MSRQYKTASISIVMIALIVGPFSTMTLGQDRSSIEVWNSLKTEVVTVAESTLDANATTDDETLVARGRAAMQQGAYARALGLLTDAIAADSTSLDARTQRMVAASRSTPPQWEVALRDAEVLIRANPNAECPWRFMGEASYHTGDMDKTISSMTTAIKLNTPYLATALSYRGHAYMRKKRFGSSIPDFERAYNMSPTFWTRKALHRAREGQHWASRIKTKQLATKDVEVYRQRYETLRLRIIFSHRITFYGVVARNEIPRVVSRQADIRSAIEALSILHHLGVTTFKVKPYEGARYSTEVMPLRQRAELNAMLAWALQSREYTLAAAFDFSDALRSWSRDENLHYLAWARLFHSLGEHEMAIKDFDRAATLGMRFMKRGDLGWYDYYLRGLSREQLGELRRAQADLTLSLQRARSVPAHDALQRVSKKVAQNREPVRKALSKLPALLREIDDFVQGAK